ncbi:PREDICTED: agamous-like MADS-box protein AGL80 [Tarenaya hassleriana]|uniref:agamous-like MADS-box protein AGL80 n=1 Tax=Tarenaya hassleriana TaxID=28532 RepID=UPI00053C8473|nr:PREDICTED: agamous-like MADS-box protein AGL80 [Tarenaya hassleriana]
MRPATGKRKVKLAWIVNENARKASLKKRKLGLVKKVQELTILCDVKACLIIFSADEAAPLVWPNPEVARGLLDRYFALPDIERSKKATNQESYLRDKTGKAQEQLLKSQKKNREAEMDHLMFEINNGNKRLSDLSTNEVYSLISYSREKIGLLRKRGELIHQPPLRNVPGLPNQPANRDAAAGGEGNGVGANPMDDQNQYLMDQWIFHPAGSSTVALPLSVAPPTEQQTITYQDDPTYIQMGISLQQPGSFLPAQGNGGSSSSTNPNLEMSLMSAQNSNVNFNGMSRLANHPSYQRIMNMNLNNNSDNPRGETSLVPMGLGLPSIGGHSRVQPMMMSHLRSFHSNFTGNELGMMGAAAREGSSSRAPFRSDLRLNHQRNRGESSSAGGALRLQPPGEGSSSVPRDVDMDGPSGSNKDPPDQ